MSTALHFGYLFRLSIALSAATMILLLPESANAQVAANEDAKADYQRKLAEYQAAQQEYEALSQPYWKSVEERRLLRSAKHRNGELIVADDFVLTQPPKYAGPSRPTDPAASEQTPATSTEIPVVADFLKNALAQFQFVPQTPKSEIEFKKAYVKIAAKAGLTKEQIVRVYAFESGGNGKYDVQAGLEYERPHARAISTALGYNQLLNTNSVELIAEQGEKFVTSLRSKSSALKGPARAVLEHKIAVLQRMIEFSRSVPDDWSEHTRLASMPQGLGVHALNLDVDVGPLLQTQKLLDSIIFARRKGLLRTLSASELEMMNLTGDGNGFDMISIPLDIRDQIPTSNFFQRGGYERNPIVIVHDTVAKLIAATDAKMDAESMLDGAKELAAAF
jgi:hypothetical protein